MAGDNGNGNGAQAKMREVALSQIVWAVTVVGAIVVAVWGVATWSNAIATSWQQPIEQMKQELSTTKALLDGQRGVIDAQQKTLATLVEFMNAQTTARRAAGEREQLRKELCRSGELKGDRCQSLPSDAEIEALRR